jgi:hypothetical protein
MPVAKQEFAPIGVYSLAHAHRTGARLNLSFWNAYGNAATDHPPIPIGPHGPSGLRKKYFKASHGVKDYGGYKDLHTFCPEVIRPVYTSGNAPKRA